MRTRVAAPTLVGGSLVVLVVVATVAVGWLLWARADDRERIADERAAQSVNEALQNSIGRVVTSLRASAGLVDAQGAVDEASFRAYARAVGSIGATDALALAEIVTSEQRQGFEANRGRRISELARIGVFRAAAERPTYVPIVAVWPEAGSRGALLGFDLMSDPIRRTVLLRARETRRTAFSGLVALITGGRGFLALRPIYPPTGGGRADPVGYVSATFGTGVISQVLGRLPPEVRARVTVGGKEAYVTGRPPDTGAIRSVTLGDRRWLVTASGEEASHASALAILAGGAILALMLGAFTWSRITSERRLKLAHDAERAARERSELLERIASHLAAAADPHEVAASTVADLAAAGIDAAAVRIRRENVIETLAAVGAAADLDEAGELADEAIRTGNVVGWSPGRQDARLSSHSGARPLLGSALAVPLLGTRGDVVGALVAGSRRHARLAGEMRPVIVGVAEQCGVALERARLSSVDLEARRRAEILQSLVASLSAAALPTEVAEASIPCLFEAFDAALCTVGIAAGDDVRTLKVPAGSDPESWHWRPVPLATSTPTADAMRAREPLELHGRDRISEAYPPDVERLLTGIVSMVVVPLRRAAGAIGVAFDEERVLTDAERTMLDAIAEELGRSLERAALLESERDARQQAELMERNAARLAAATTVADVAAATVAEFEAFGASVVFVWRLSDSSSLETLGSSDVPVETRRRFGTYPLELGGLVSDAMRTGSLIATGSAEEYDARYPAMAAERRRLGVESLLSLPLRTASGAVVGAIFAAASRPRWITDDRRSLVLGVAEQTGVALERAQLFETEREARRLAELLEQNAAHLAAAVTVGDVATSTVADLEDAGIGLAVIHLPGRDGPEALAVAGTLASDLGPVASRTVDVDVLAAEVLRTGDAVEVETVDELDTRYPGAEVIWRQVGAAAVLSVPLRAQDRHVIGVLGVGSRRRRWLHQGMRQVILGVAEQCGLALERAKLQAEAERAAQDTSFLAVLGESLERATTVGARARRLVEVLTEERATFAAVHLVDEDGGLDEVADAGSRPQELGDDDLWEEWVRDALATGRDVPPGVHGPDGESIPAASSLLVLPLRARGHALGALTLRSAAGVDWRPVIAPALAREIAGRAALALDNALLYEREREVSHTLQLGLLGGGVPSFDGVVVTPAYRPGTAALEVGGDWYDAFPLESGTVALVVGDVVGHGLEAAVAMGQLRGAVSALAQTAGPAVLLDRLDAFVETVPSAATATLAYVELDRGSGRMRYACAGHPPPLVVSPDGRTRFLWDGRSAPLGSMLGDARGEAVDHLDEGDTLVLYTDGLVERRSASIDAGLERLAAAAKLQPLGAPALADDVCDALLGGQAQDDDVCVLTIHRIPSLTMFSHSFPASPAELSGLRERLRAWLVEHGVGDEIERAAVLAVSEAAANAVEHGYGCDGTGIVTVMARLADDRLDVTVRDEGIWREQRRDTDRGRGLMIMRAIVDDFSIAQENGATVLRMSQSAREPTSA